MGSSCYLTVINCYLTVITVINIQNENHLVRSISRLNKWKKLYNNENKILRKKLCLTMKKNF